MFKKKLYILIVILALIGCNKEEPEKEINGTLIEDAVCIGADPDSISYIKYNYDTISEKLHIDHYGARLVCDMNVYYNCELFSNMIVVDVFNNIVPGDILPTCKCNYFIPMVIENVPKKEYELQIISSSDDDVEFQFNIDLISNTSDSICIQLW